MEVDEHYPDNIPVLRIPNVQDRLILDDLLFLKNVSKERVLRYAATKGWTVIVGSNGNPNRVGNAVYIDENRGFLFASFLMALRSTDLDKLEPKFLYYFISSRFIQQAITESVQGTTGLSNLSQRTLFELPMPQFQVTDQRRIAAILDTVDEAIRQTEAVIEKLKKITMGLLHDLLTRGIGKDGKLRPTPEQAPFMYKDSPLGKIPKDWEILRVKEYGEVRGGKRLPFGHSYSPQATSYQYLRVVDFFEREIAFSTLLNLERKTYNAIRRYEIRPGDIFISIAGSLGFSGVFRPTPGTSVILTENAARICLHVKNLLPDYLVYQLNGLQVQKQINEEKGVGGGVPKLALFRIESLQIAVPPAAEQEGIISRTNLIENHIRSEKYAREKLASLKQGLMEDLLSGRVRVNALPKNVVDMLDAIPGWN